jgi:hypothetical protein
MRELRLGNGRFIDGLLLGAASGFSSLFKYHGAFLCGSLLVALLVLQFRKNRFHFGFLSGVIVGGVLLVSPILLWNIQQDWASLSFQGSHGFSAMRFNLVFGLRILFGQFLLMSPLVAVLVYRLLKWHTKSDLHRLILFTSLPLWILITGVAFFKASLPHWALPAMVPLIPLVALIPWPSWSHLNFKLMMIPLFLASLLLGLPFTRSYLVNQMMDERAGLLAELTLWEPLAEEVSKLIEDAAAEGHKIDAIASTRWFWTAQLAYHLQNQPRVYCLDNHRSSYYWFRDDLSTLQSKVVLIVGDADHKRVGLDALMDVKRSGDIEVPGHKDQKVSYMIAVVTGTAAEWTRFAPSGHHY